jgi:hypothetical protein
MQRRRHPKDYELYNKNGDVMCHIVGCRKHKELYTAHNGLFCREHVPIVQELRLRIKPHGGGRDEAIARLTEIAVRKDVDERHIFYAEKLATRHQIALS